MTIVTQLIGASSAAIISKAEGEFFSDVVGPLGNPSAFVDKTDEELKGQRYIFIAGVSAPLRSTLRLNGCTREA